MSTLLVIGYVWPEPNSSAAGSRMLQLIAFFQTQGFTITFASPAAASDHAIDFAAHQITPVSISLNCSSFDAFISELKPSVVLFDRFMMEEQFGWRVAKCCPNAIRILDTEDLHCLRDARHQLAKQGQSCVNAQLIANDLLFSELAIREVAAIFRSDLSLMISEVEMQLLQQRFHVPPSQLVHLPFMLPTATTQGWLPIEQKHHFISIGNFRHAPNWDAVLQLKQHIWPLIRQALPQAELHIYGAYPPKKATDLHNPKQGFLVQGWVDDAKQAMSQSRVLLAPLRFGAGIKGKLVEAMQMGTPSVTTSIGAESMHGEQPWPGVIADEVNAFANAAIALYQDEARLIQCQQQGLALLTEYYDEGKWHKRLAQRLAPLHTDLTQHRSQHFIGMMLQHHSMKSTQYMAQWIEAKNKHVKEASHGAPSPD